jgi:hypothetical protein
MRKPYIYQEIKSDIIEKIESGELDAAGARPSCDIQMGQHRPKTSLANLLFLLDKR